MGATYRYVLYTKERLEAFIKEGKSLYTDISGVIFTEEDKIGYIEEGKPARECEKEIYLEEQKGYCSDKELKEASKAFDKRCDDRAEDFFFEVNANGEEI